MTPFSCDTFKVHQQVLSWLGFHILFIPLIISEEMIIILQDYFTEVPLVLIGRLRSNKIIIIVKFIDNII